MARPLHTEAIETFLLSILCTYLDVHVLETNSDGVWDSTWRRLAFATMGTETNFEGMKGLFPYTSKGREGVIMVEHLGRRMYEIREPVLVCIWYV